jgi:hypothetical protein
MLTPLRTDPADASKGSDSRAQTPCDVDCHLDGSPAIAEVATEVAVGAAGAASPTIVAVVVVVVVVAIAAGPGWCSMPWRRKVQLALMYLHRSLFHWFL